MVKGIAAFSLVLVTCTVLMRVSPVGADSARCLMCHSAPGLSKETNGKQTSLHVDPSGYKSSVHGKLDCIQCHMDFANQGFPHKQGAKAVQCSGCHKAGNHVGAPKVTPMAEYADSVHGIAAEKGDADAPTCKDCHGTHAIRSGQDPKSAIYRANIAETCGKCHNDSKLTDRHHIPGPTKIKRYKESVHGKAVTRQGLLTAAVCTDCHGVHHILAADNPESSVAKPHVPETCGKCHKGIYKQFQTSIHGQAVAKGIKEAPVCTDCHGEHSIQRPTEKASSVSPIHVVATCSKCHEDMKIERKYGLPANRLSSYIDSYHGVANKYGDTTVANCASCHGAHDILPSSDPRSAIHKDRLPETCGKCHPNAGANFARGSIHVLPSMKQDKGVYWVRLFYTAFVTVLISSFVGYIALDLFARARGRSRRRKEGGR